MHVTINEVGFEVAEGVDSSWWGKIGSGKWEPHTFKVFDSFIKPDKCYIDLGVWIGPTVLYGASKARHCYCADPDPYSNYRFMRNLSLNPSLQSKVTFFRGCVGDMNGTVRFGSPSFGNSCSSMFSEKDSIVVKSITMQRFFEMFKISDVNFIKIDIEGGESLVIPSSAATLAELGVPLLLSFHINNFPNKVENVQSICSSLKFYKHVYTRNGDEISHDALLAGLMNCCETYNRKWGLFEGVFTNEPWVRG